MQQTSTQGARPVMPVKTQLALARKQKLIDEIKLMFHQGVGIRAIPRELHINRATVRKYLQMEVALPKNVVPKTKIFLFEDCIRNAVATRPGVLIKDLYKEINAMGYQGKTTVAYAHIGKYMPKRGEVIYPKEWPQVFWRLAQVSLLLYRKENELHSRDWSLVSYLVKESPEIETCYCFFQGFQEMLENKDGGSLGKWVEDVMACSIKEFRSFGQGVLNDFTAVQNAFIFPWSNGHVEGQVNKP